MIAYINVNLKVRLSLIKIQSLVEPDFMTVHQLSQSGRQKPRREVKKYELLLIKGSDMFSFFLSAEDPDPRVKPGNSCWGRWLSSGSISAKPVLVGGDGRS